MNLLLDTQVFLWWLWDLRKLGRIRAAIVDPDNEVFVSAVTAWEMAIKKSLGKLDVPAGLDVWVPTELDRNQFNPLPVSVRHASAVEQLPLHHRDPFDRLLIAQGARDDLTIATDDPRFEQYAVRVLRP